MRKFSRESSSVKKPFFLKVENAIAKGKTDEVLDLLTNDTNPEKDFGMNGDGRHWSPLTYAFAYGKLDVARKLLEHGAKLFVIGESGVKSPLYGAVSFVLEQKRKSKKTEDLFSLFLKNGQYPQHDLAKKNVIEAKELIFSLRNKADSKVIAYGMNALIEFGLILKDDDITNLLCEGLYRHAVNLMKEWPLKKLKEFDDSMRLTNEEVMGLISILNEDINKGNFDCKFEGLLTFLAKHPEGEKLIPIFEKKTFLNDGREIKVKKGRRRKL